MPRKWYLPKGLPKKLTLINHNMWSKGWIENAWGIVNQKMSINLEIWSKGVKRTNV